MFSAEPRNPAESVMVSQRNRTNRIQIDMTSYIRYIYTPIYSYAAVCTYIHTRQEIYFKKSASLKFAGQSSRLEIQAKVDVAISRPNSTGQRLENSFFLRGPLSLFLRLSADWL